MHPAIERHLPALRELCARHPVRHLSICGSAATGAFDPERSDVDVLVGLRSVPAELRETTLLALRDDLQRLFERDVDLVDQDAVTNPYLRRTIERTRRRIYHVDRERPMPTRVLLYLHEVAEACARLTTLLAGGSRLDYAADPRLQHEARRLIGRIHARLTATVAAEPSLAAELPAPPELAELAARDSGELGLVWRVVDGAAPLGAAAAALLERYGDA